MPGRSPASGHGRARKQIESVEKKGRLSVGRFQRAQGRGHRLGGSEQWSHERPYRSGEQGCDYAARLCNWMGNLRQFYLMFSYGVVAMEVGNKYGKEIKVLEFRSLYRTISHKPRRMPALRWRKS